MTSQTYLILLVGLVLLFYLMILRPQRRAKAQREQMLSALVPGTRVITAGGIHGTILEVDEGVLDLEVAEGVVLQVDPRAVAEVVPEDEDEDEDEDDEGDEDVDVDDHGDEVDEVDKDAGGEQDAPGVGEPRP
jgi:preprotein translocase subunit YajC